jgi:hypothetical protein
MKRGFMVLNATTGESHIYGVAQNTPKGKAGCTCGRCGTKPRTAPSRVSKPFDRDAAVQHARQLDERAQNAATDTERRTWEDRASLVWDLVELEDRKAARAAAIMTEVRMGREIRPIIGAAYEDSILND